MLITVLTSLICCSLITNRTQAGSCMPPYFFIRTVKLEIHGQSWNFSVELRVLKFREVCNYRLIVLSTPEPLYFHSHELKHASIIYANWWENLSGILWFPVDWQCTGLCHRNINDENAVCGKPKNLLKVGSIWLWNHIQVVNKFIWLLSESLHFFP